MKNPVVRPVVLRSRGLAEFDLEFCIVRETIAGSMPSAVPQKNAPAEAAPPPPDRMLNIMAWLELHRGQLITAFLVLVAVIAAIYLWRHNAARKEAAANAALLAVRAPESESGDIPGVAPASDYLEVAERFPGTTVAPRARLLAAGSLFLEEQYGDALAQFRRAQDAAGSGPIAAQAAYGVAASIEAQGGVDEAITAYRSVITEYPDESVADQARLALARIHEARSEFPMALQLYDEVLRTADPGPFAQMAEQQRETLLRRHPDLAGTNAIPPAVVN